jgi:hypothetical protein
MVKNMASPAPATATSPRAARCIASRAAQRTDPRIASCAAQRTARMQPAPTQRIASHPVQRSTPSHASHPVQRRAPRECNQPARSGRFRFIFFKKKLWSDMHHKF